MVVFGVVAIEIIGFSEARTGLLKLLFLREISALLIIISINLINFPLILRLFINPRIINTVGSLILPADARLAESVVDRFVLRVRLVLLFLGIVVALVVVEVSSD